MISRNIADRPLNITSILNNFESFIKQVDKKKMDAKYYQEKGSK